MATFNGARWIEEQLVSIAGQTGVDVTIRLSDDGSTDDTVEIVKGFSLKHNVQLLSPPSPTGAASQNFFWLICNTSSAGYAYVALSDQDDIWMPDKLSRACAALAASGSAAVSSAVIAFWENGRQVQLSQPTQLSNSDFLFEGAGQGCTFVLTAPFYERVREFCLAHQPLIRSVAYHDWTIYALSRAWKLKWLFDPCPRLRYRQHSGNDTGARLSMAGISRRFDRIRDGWYGTQLTRIAEICYAAAPSERLILRWRKLFEKRGIGRRLSMAWFCFRGGRRRVSDNAILIFAILAGWI